MQFNCDEVLGRVKQMRNETNKLCESDLVLEDGVVLMSRAVLISTRNDYDKLIARLSTLS